MTYRILHKTTYTYEQPVSLGNHVAYLIPRSQPHHICMSHELRITPAPDSLRERLDFFGNTSSFFTIREPHNELNIEACSRVLVEGPPVRWPDSGPAWDEVVRSLASDLTEDGLNAYQFVFESPRVRPGAAFASYASPSFPPGRPLTDALLNLTARSRMRCSISPRGFTKTFASIPKPPPCAPPPSRSFAPAGGFVRTLPTCRSRACDP